VPRGIVTPYEYISQVILPALRGLAAHRLSNMGYRQYSIARLLGVSQPMVHRYLLRSEAEYFSRLREEGIEEAVIGEALEVAVRALTSNDTASFLLVVNELALRSRYCREAGCERILCPGGDVLAIGYYERVLEKLASLSCLETLIPEVGSNLAYSPRGPAEPGEIIALDGRIVKSKGGVVIAGKPRPGGSRHTAGILSRYSRLNPRLRWALALSPRESLINIIKRRGIPLIPLGRDPPGSGLVAVLEEAAPGREAVVYILAPKADDIIKLAEEAARAECR
jgi:predicted fused transcriptional regulator/phosphomethylpyrimidine kinase/predicted transcriptional regulator